MHRDVPPTLLRQQPLQDPWLSSKSFLGRGEARRYDLHLFKEPGLSAHKHMIFFNSPSIGVGKDPGSVDVAQRLMAFEFPL